MGTITVVPASYGHSVNLEIGPRPYDDPDVVRLVAEVQAWYVEVYGSPDEAALVDDEFRAPNGQLLVGTLDGEAVAMGGWRRLPDGTAEVKRMYVSPAVQRRGLAAKILAALEQSAAAAGIERLVLNTGAPQVAAIALYEANGYTPTTPFGYYAGHAQAVFLSKNLCGRT